MGYEGGSLVDLFRESTTEPPTTRLLHRVANDAGEAMTAAAADATPKRTGEVASSWRTLEPVEVGTGTDRAVESGTTNPDYRARFLEYGTEAHLISPKTRKALVLPEGARAAAHHPGIQAHHMTSRAAAEVEASFDVIAADALHTWQREVEDAAKQHKGIE
jgi:hypothetical protein